ncbi:MAG: OadG family protein [Acetatifactor sp.]|nr:OadG family protein [Acetatifactor sp.]
MKKLLTFVCMLACIFGLTACGSEEVMSQRDQESLTEAKQKAQYVVYLLADVVGKDESLDFLSNRSSEEVEYIVENAFGLEADGYGFSTAIDSFSSAIDSVGNIYNSDGTIKFGEINSKINGSQVIVEMEVNGTNKNAVAEIIFSNDLFMKLESAALNPDAGIGELMTGAALNTLIGMCMVFAVLILISAIISCFKVIPALQKKSAEKKAQKTEIAREAKTESTVVQSSVNEENSEDDFELAAVIAAAIAAYEGSASTDGYVVRSIRRRWS